MASKYLYEETISNKYLKVTKTLKANSREELKMKIQNQMEIWAEQEQRKRTREAIKEEKDRATYDTEQAKKEINKYQNILKETIDVDDKLKWETLLNKQVFKAFSFKEQPPSLEEIYKRLSVPAPSFLEKIFSSKTKNRLQAEEKAKQVYQQEMSDFENRKDAARAEYEKQLAAFEKEKAEHNASVEKFRTDFENGDSTAIENYVRLVLEKSHYPDAIKKEFDVKYDEPSGTVVINYWLPSTSEVPRITEYKYIASRREIKPVEMKAKEFEQFYESVILQITLRTFHEVFESVYIPNVQAVVFNGWVQGIDLTTGNDFTSCIISCRATREEFNKINLARVSPKECIRNLKGLIAGPLAQLAPVKPIMDINKEDSRFIESKEILAELNSIDNLAEMPWEDFEHLVRELFAKIFTKEGAEVRVTQASRDGGVDAIAFDPDPIRGGKYVIQAKRFNNVVPVSAVRDLYGTMINEGAVKGILVTTSYFGADSRDFVKDKPISLIDGSNLVYLFQEHGYNVKIETKRR